MGWWLFLACKPAPSFEWGVPGPYSIALEEELHLNSEELLHNDGSDYPWNRGPGMAIEDFDGDGYLDVAVAFPYKHAFIFLNRKEGKLIRTGHPLTPGIGLAAADLDDDGDADLLMTNRRSVPEQIFWNDGTGNFPEVTKLPDSSGESRTPTFGDVDNDGDLDLFVSGFSTQSDTPETALGDGHQLFLREGDQWIESTLPSEVLSSLSYQASFLDVDQDGDADLYLSNDFGATTQPNRLLLNDGTGHFEVDAACNCTPTLEGMGVGVGDVDENGWLDLLLSDVDGVRLLQGEQASYWDATLSEGANPNRLEAGPTWGVAVADLDLDGRNDLLAAAGRLFNEVPPEGQPSYQRDLLMQGTDSGFQEVEGFEEDETSRAIAVADLDRDGRPDLLTTSLVGLQVWHNATPSPRNYPESGRRPRRSGGHWGQGGSAGGGAGASPLDMALYHLQQHASRALYRP